MKQNKSTYPVRLFLVKVNGNQWTYAETCLHMIEGHKQPYFSTTNYCGAAHDEILKSFPELKPLVALHLAGMDGLPMHALGNSFYHYAEGVKGDGTREYYASEEEKKEEQERRTEAARAAFFESQAAHNTGQELADAWNTVTDYKHLRKEYESELFQNAQKYKIESKMNVLTLVVPRNNAALASILRITEEEAAAIPAGLTESEFNQRYILPNIARWKKEALAATAYLNRETDYLPDTLERGKVYYFNHETFIDWKFQAFRLYGIHKPRHMDD